MRTLLITLAAAIPLGACVSVLPEPEAPEALYRIEATTPPLSLDRTVLIREPEAPQIMSGRAMVREDAVGAMRLMPRVEWAGRSTRLMQLALVDSFSGGPGGAVLPESGVGAEYEYAVRLTTLGFEGDDAVCSGTASLIEARTRKLVFQDRVSVRNSADQGRPETLKQVSEACVSEFASLLSEALNSQENIDETR